MRQFIFFAIVMTVVSFAQAATECGGQLQPRCEVNVASDIATDAEDAARRAEIDAKNTTLKGALDSIDSNKFQWSFIPQIPTSGCVNPSIESPNGSGAVEMDVCSKFYIFQKFINGVLAFFCVIGCVRQVQGALSTK